MFPVLYALLLAEAFAVDSNQTCDALLCQGVPPKFQVLPGLRIRACQEAGHDYCPIHKVNVINEIQCWKLCESLTSCCRLFTYNAKLGHCFIYDQDFYTSWTSVDATDGNWTSYYKYREDGLKLLYKVSKSINVDVTDTYLTQPGQLFATQNQMDKDATCGCYVKSQVVDYWSKFPITQVAVTLATAGTQVKQVTFSAVGESASSFFKQRNILSSSWTDLTAWSPMWGMSVPPIGGSYNRAFFIAKTAYVACNTDLQWMSVYSKGTKLCNYDLTPVPTMAYAEGPTAAYVNTNASFADALLIYAKM